ncbi:hypothetical protein EDD11_002350 [Mortierella claussenii]|nr:hypothetical protein EDD11_002350 [Mortierella claussenii]
MVPDPLCPQCHSEFVEKIEEENDPRNFVEPAGEGGEQGGDDQEAHETLSMEDLLRLFQLISGPPRSLQERQRLRAQRQNSQPGDFPADTDGSMPLLFNPNYRPSSAISAGARPSQSQANSDTTTTRSSESTSAIGVSREDGDVDMAEPLQGDDEEEEIRELPQYPPTSLASLLERIGFELHVATEGGQTSPGGAGGFGSLFNMIGNPGDYVFSQGALDDIITQMMEMQGRQSGPVGASDEIIESIPPHILTDEELEAKIECSVCKDEFTKEDDKLLQLKCKHIFHDDCIKPWLKMNGTCPTCRFALVPQNEEHNDDQQDGAVHNQAAEQLNRRGDAERSGTQTGSDGSSTGSGDAGGRTSRVPGAFPTSTRYSPYYLGSNGSNSSSASYNTSNIPSAPAPDDVD